jgi:predicted RNA methylase
MTFPIKKKNLISIVQSMEGFSKPNVKLEQYITDAISTVDFLFYIGVDNDDILGNIIVDIGAGTGRLCLTSLLMGAKSVFAIEKDYAAIQILKKNANDLDLSSEITIIQKDITVLNNEDHILLRKNISDLSDTNTDIICVMNPPFGVQVRYADRPFLQLAMELCDKIYSVHLSNAKTRSFLDRFTKSRGWEIESIHSQKMIIEGTYSFHSKKRKEILADVYKIEKKKN